MSLVGTRPPTLDEINAFLHSEQYQKRMLKLKACSQKHKTAVRIKLSLMLRNKYIAFVKPERDSHNLLVVCV